MAQAALPQGKPPLYEFSTGIHIEMRPSEPNGWISRGFTGQYINNTIGQIPYHVERAIANKFFAVTEGSKLDEPAIIGRVISGNNDHPDYAVIAIVSRGKDEKGRPLSVTRYFLTEGQHKLPHIIWCFEEYKKSAGKYPVFNPNGQDSLQRYWNICPANFSLNIDSQPQVKTWLAQQLKLPIVIDPSCYTLEKLHILTANKMSSNPQEIAWAYNAAALEKPLNFVMIQPLDQLAFQNINNSIQWYESQNVAAVSYDQAKVKSAIKSFLKSSLVTTDAVRAIAEYIDILEDKDWHELFNAEGANQAITQNISSDPMARLLTLRAILIPDTLYQFLEWINRKVNQSLQAVSTDFQNQLYQFFINNFNQKYKFLQEKLAKGIESLLPKLFSDEIKPDYILVLCQSKNFGDKGMIWGKEVKTLINNIKEDLNYIISVKNPSYTQQNYQRNQQKNLQVSGNSNNNLFDNWVNKFKSIIETRGNNEANNSASQNLYSEEVDPLTGNPIPISNSNAQTQSNNDQVPQNNHSGGTGTPASNSTASSQIRGNSAQNNNLGRSQTRGVQQLAPNRLKCDYDILWKEIYNGWYLLNSSSPSFGKYESLAIILAENKEWKTAAWFYQISTGKCPDSVFKSAFGTKKEKNYLGVNIKKETTPWDVASWFIFPLIVLMAIILVGGGSVILIQILFYSISDNSAGKLDSKSSQPAQISDGLKQLNTLVDDVQKIVIGNNPDEKTKNESKTKIINQLIAIICVKNSSCLDEKDIIKDADKKLNNTATLGEEKPSVAGGPPPTEKNENYQNNRKVLGENIFEYQQQKYKEANNQKSTNSEHTKDHNDSSTSQSPNIPTVPIPSLTSTSKTSEENNKPNGIIDTKTIGFLKDDILGQLREERGGKLFQSEADAIFTSGKWEKTKQTIRILVNEVKAEIPQELLNDKSPDKVDYAIKLAITQTLDDDGTLKLKYTGVIDDGTPKLNPQELTKQKYSWVNAISSFQYKNKEELKISQENYGIINSQSDPTYIKLKEMVLKQSQGNLGKSAGEDQEKQEQQVQAAINDFDTKTSPALKKLIGDVYQEIIKKQELKQILERRYPGYETNREQLEFEIKNQLNQILKTANLSIKYVSSPEEKIKWISAIKQYQKSKELPIKDGVISDGGKTYKALKPDLINKVTQTLKAQQPPPQNPN